MLSNIPLSDLVSKGTKWWPTLIACINNIAINKLEMLYFQVFGWSFMFWGSITKIIFLMTENLTILGLVNLPTYIASCYDFQGFRSTGCLAWARTRFAFLFYHSFPTEFGDTSLLCQEALSFVFGFIGEVEWLNKNKVTWKVVYYSVGRGTDNMRVIF